jgi:hypothetical protein
VNTSAGVFALVPPSVLTVTSTRVPAGQGVLNVVISLSETTVVSWAGTPPNSTRTEVPERFCPRMSTLVPPSDEPDIGLMDSTTGWLVEARATDLLPTTPDVAATSSTPARTTLRREAFIALPPCTQVLLKKRGGED